MRRIVIIMAALFISSMLFLPVQADVQLAQFEDVIIDPIQIKATMTYDGVTTLYIRARAINQGPSSIATLSFRIESHDVAIIDSQVNGTDTNSTVVFQERYSEIIVDLLTTLSGNESAWVELTIETTGFQTDSTLSLDSTTLYADFSFYIRPMIEYANLTFTTVLPQDAVLSRESLVPLFPSAESNYTDGASLAFVWFIDSLQVGQERAFTVRYQYPNSQQGPLGSFLYESILIAILGIFAGAFLTIGGPKVYHRIKRIGSVKFVGVTSEEEEVLAVIRKKGGSCPQKDLYTEFDMSQAKVSLILNNLEERGLVRRFREGRENVVHIMED